MLEVRCWLYLPKTSQGKGVAAAQTQISLLRDADELLFSVSEGFGDGVAVPCVRAAGCCSVSVLHGIVDLFGIHVYKLEFRKHSC